MSAKKPIAARKPPQARMKKPLRKWLLIVMLICGGPMGWIALTSKKVRILLNR
jgi:hypothetical protein